MYSPVCLEPGVGRGDLAFEQLAQQRMESRAVIEMHEMRDLVRDHRTADEIGRHRQPPVDAHHALGRATAPAPAGAGEAQLRRRHAGNRAVMGQVLGQQQLGLALEPTPQPRRQRLARAA